MKGKTISIILAMLLALNVLATLQFAHADDATMYIDPSYVDGGLTPGDTFTVTVMFRDFVDLWVFQVQIAWTTAILDCTAFRYGVTLSGDVFDVLAPSQGVLAMSGGIDHGAGLLKATSVSLTQPPSTGVTGTAGVGYKLVELDFEVVGYGTATISFDSPPTKTFWSDSTLVKQACNFESGTAETEAPPAPYGPECCFTWLPVIPQNATTVNFDATCSKPGFDGTSVCQITEWRWNFDDGTGWFNGSGYETIGHEFAVPGDYNVCLEVYAPGAVPEIDLCCKTVTVVGPSLGAAIDLYTCSHPDYNGEGPDVDCDAFAPQALVCLCAKVTYNDDPVEGKIVGFEVRDAEDNCVIYRTSITNASGIDCIEFRIPSMPAFGSWIAIAIVEVAGTVVADTMPFEVGWIIEILSITPTDTSFNKLTNAEFDLEIKNIGKTTKTPTITVVIYDECKVPIGQVVIDSWDIPAGTTAPFYTEIAIPSWAFVGTAIVYANAYTDLPMYNGVPYCPEAENSFRIDPA